MKSNDEILAEMDRREREWLRPAQKLEAGKVVAFEIPKEKNPGCGYEEAIQEMIDSGQAKFTGWVTVTHKKTE